MSAAEEILLESYGIDIDPDEQLEIDAVAEATDDPVARSARWLIETDDAAEWALLKIRKERARIAEVSERAARQRDLLQAEIDRINEAERRALAAPERSINFFESRLIEYLRTVQQDDPRKKSLKLLNGTLLSRRSPAHLEVDPEVFIPWAEANRAELLRVRKDPDKAAIKKLITTTGPDDKPVDPETGEIIPGVAIEAGSVRYTVEVPDVG